ncbi:F0F1 ATP synthase subunit delta [Methylacidiphilum caldifontis]|uniref:F0F1 ATP synthase subunit delta n=1 Tax=Methylacidiphilum caldifontis TaxID=2795386 RepID=UPI001A8C588A|nr:F0F1 ATP synthase subunit delta [Methylacidiphilum caldifontis]QSR89116.1 F0F1 ATP synthase subunit delta [Methylacidiphilum caldifontis]
MNWNKTTFILQIVNFLVFVWLLKRFLYKPVLNLIRQRKETVQAMWKEAEKLKEEAVKLRSDYENRLKVWEEEKKRAREELEEELRVQREKLIAENQKALELEKERNKVLEEKRKRDLEIETQAKALQLGARFVARFFSNLASEEVESKLIALCLKKLRSLPAETLELIRRSMERESVDKGVVKSVFPIGEEVKRGLKETISQIVEKDLPLDFDQDPKLLAGIRIIIGSWIVRASIEDELEFFTEAENDKIKVSL